MVVLEIFVGLVLIMIFQELSKKPRTNQYGSRYVELDGYTFDSSREANRYLQLRGKQLACEISDLEVHPKFILQTGFRDRHGTYHRPISYSPDFTYREPDGTMVAEDVKSEATVRDDCWKLKAKLFVHMYGHDYDFRVVG